MAPGGLLLLHDYNAQWPCVMQAVADMWHDHGLVWVGALGNVARMMIRG